MFYSTQILSKKGPLGTIWIASHLEKRLKRSQIFETSIPASVDSIMNPEAPLALRLSGQLLLGVVRVYMRQMDYLSKDAQSAVDSLHKTSAHGANVDLEGNGTAAYNAITLDDYDPVLQENAFSFHGATSDLFASGGDEGFVTRLSAGDSLTAVEDVSDFFGSHWGFEEERFEASGEDVQRRFSVELERLRAEAAAPPPDPGDMFFQAPLEDDLVPVPGGEEMDALGEGLFALPPGATPGKTPQSAGGAPLPGTSDIHLTPHSLGLDMIPEVEGGQALSGGTFGGGDTPGKTPQAAVAAAERDTEGGAAGDAAAPTPAQQRQQQRRRRKPHLDVDAIGRPATTLSTQEIRALLTNRAPLLTTRGRLTNMPRAAATADVPFLNPLGLGSLGDEGRHSLIYRPGNFPVLAPELVEVYRRAMQVEVREPGGGQPPLPAADKRAATPAASAGWLGEEGGEAGPSTAGGFGSPGLPSAGAGWGMGEPSGLMGEASLEFAAPPAGPDDYVLDYEPGPGPPGSPRGAPSPAGPEDGGDEGGTLAPLVAALGSGDLASIPAGAGEVEEGGGQGGAAEGGFTERSRRVLGEFRMRFEPGTGSKRRHPSAGGLTAAPLSLLEVVRGRDRGEAARWFYESLVLRNNDFVELEQREPYQDIMVRAGPRLAAANSSPGR